MKKQFFYTSLVLIALVFISSCGKYDDGPSFSIRTKTGRLSGTWKIVKVFMNGAEQQLSADAQNNSFVFENDGTGNIFYTQGTSTLSIDLEWAFGDSKETIRVRYKDFLTGEWDEWDESTILRLTNKEFWMEDTENSSTDVYINHFEKQ